MKLTSTVKLTGRHRSNKTLSSGKHRWIIRCTWPGPANKRRLRQALTKGPLTQARTSSWGRLDGLVSQILDVAVLGAEIATVPLRGSSTIHSPTWGSIASSRTGKEFRNNLARVEHLPSYVEAHVRYRSLPGDRKDPSCAKGARACRRLHHVDLYPPLQRGGGERSQILSPRSGSGLRGERNRELQRVCAGSNWSPFVRASD